MLARFSLAQILLAVAAVALLLAILFWIGLVARAADGIWVVTSIDDSQLTMCHGTDPNGAEAIWDDVTFVAVCRDGGETIRLPLGTFMYLVVTTGVQPKLDLSVGDRFRVVKSKGEIYAIQLNDGTIIVPDA